MQRQQHKKGKEAGTLECNAVHLLGLQNIPYGLHLTSNAQLQLLQAEGLGEGKTEANTFALREAFLRPFISEFS